MAEQVQDALQRAQERTPELLQSLQELIAIRSISSEAAARPDCERAAAWLADKLRALPQGTAQIFETSRNPIVYGRCGPAAGAARTILLYGHYDVQTPEPLGDWSGDPFRAELRGDRFYGRGASDMKGPLLAALFAIEALAAAGGLPGEIKFIIEGDEETNAEPLQTFLEQHGELLQADICLNVDAGMLGEQLPTIVYGLRGASNCTLRVHGPYQDLHDGLYGGVVENPIHVIARVIAALQDREGLVTLPGFYERVRPMSSEERAAARRHPHGEAFYLEASGAPALIPSADFLPVERTGARPSMNVRWFNGGAQKNAIPTTAEARISFRLVPDQDPLQVHLTLLEFLEQAIPPTVRWDVENVINEPGVLVDLDTAGVRALNTALQATWGSAPILHRGGGSIPVVGELKDRLGMDSALTGFSLPEDNIHGPDENVHLPTLTRGMEAVIRFIDAFQSTRRDDRSP